MLRGLNLRHIPNETSHLLQTVSKNLNYRVARIKFKLSRDVETKEIPHTYAIYITVANTKDVTPE